ncbi:hypothetical protein [Aliamphritea spongicola]|nr:hypothetical protein [Aliamphritea spongicola]
MSFVDPESDTVYLECHQNESRIIDEQLYRRCLEDNDLAAVFKQVVSR